MSAPSSLAFLPESFHRVAADGETIYGWVATEDDAQQVIASVNREFTTSFISCYDEESKRKEERQKARMVWFSSYKDGRIIPGFVQSNRCLVCHHGGEAYKPMSHLKGKLQKEVINTFLSIITDQQNRGDRVHISVIPSYMPVQWQQGSYTHLYDKVKLPAFQWVFVPINVNQNHWILMAVNVPDRKVHIVDSLPGGGDTTVYVNQWRTFSRQHSEVLGIPDVMWEAGDLKSTVQTDGWNCGVFVCMNAMAIVRGMDLTRISAHYAAAFQRYTLAILHTKTHTLAEHLKECEVPGCVSAGKTDISCVVCGRWAHRECCNITRGTAYVCIICEAVYGV